MLFYLKLAARNLTRNLLRTIIAIAAIAAVVMIVVFGRGLMQGFNESTFNLYIDNQMGHLRLTEAEYPQREPLLSLDYTVQDTDRIALDEMIDKLGQEPEVKKVLPRLRFGAMASRDDELIRMLGVGYDPHKEEEAGILTAEIIEGELPKAGNEILLGSGLLENLEAKPGDNITLVFSDSFQSIQGRTFEIAGVRETNSPEIDDNFFYLPLETSQEMLALENEVTEIMLFGEQAEKSHQLEERVLTLLEDWEVGEAYTLTRWQQADPFMELFLEVDTAMNIIYVFFILLGAVVVVTTLFMIIRERKTEIGMMTALGLKGKEIMAIFTLEGALIGLLGSFLGVLFGGFLNYYIAQRGIAAEAFTGLVEGIDFMVEPVFYTVYDLENLLISFLLGVIITSLACLYPALSASRLNPVKALQKDA